jgi:hypothetical protein
LIAIPQYVLQRIDYIDQQFELLISPALTDSPTQLTSAESLSHQRIKVFFLTPLLAVRLRRICYESKRKCMEKLERSIATGLQQVFAVVDKSLAQILATTQDKNDFLGTDTNMSLSCSKACRKCIDLLQPLVGIVSQVLVRTLALPTIPIGPLMHCTVNCTSWTRTAIDL